jgi:protein TonB
LDIVKIGPRNIEGKADDGTITPPVESSTIAGTGLTAHKEDEPDGKFVSIQIPAEFPGGKDQWMRFLERNLNREAPTDAGAPAGKYTVAVSFKVDEHGNLSNIVAENNPGFGTAEEAVRVIKKGPAWKPAIQNGRTVAYTVRQTITFVVDLQGG